MGTTGRAAPTGRRRQQPAGWNRDFPLTRVLGRLQRESAQWHTPSMELVAAQTGDPFAVLVGTVLSLRTRDATTLAAFQRLHALAGNPAGLAALPVSAIAQAIYPVAFYRVKASQLRALAGLVLERHGGQVPAQLDALLALPGVGRKTANLVLGLGFGQAAVCVDTHVHRILNRLGALKSRQPDKTEALLRANLSRRWWLRINALLVPFGQARCGPLSPRCTGCPVAHACGRVGVARHR